MHASHGIVPEPSLQQRKRPTNVARGVCPVRALPVAGQNDGDMRRRPFGWAWSAKNVAKQDWQGIEVAELDVGQAALGPGSGCISMVVCDSLLLAGKAGKLREAEGPPGIRAQVSTPTWQSLPQEKRGKAGRLSRATSGIARQVAAIEHVLRHRRLVCQRWPGVPSCGCLQL